MESEYLQDTYVNTIASERGFPRRDIESPRSVSIVRELTRSEPTAEELVRRFKYFFVSERYVDTVRKNIKSQ